jgi:hypothetical protein
MIKKFKLFESRNNSRNQILNKLISQLDDNFIEKYYEENYKYDINDILSMYPAIIWKCIDNKKYVEDLIQNEINNADIESIPDNVIADYIINNITEDLEEKVIELYKSKNSIDDEDDDIEYDSSMLDDFDSSELIELINHLGEEDELRRDYYEDRYGNMDAEDIFDEIYGKDYIHRLGYRDIYNMFGDYFDDDEVVEMYMNDLDYDYKYETIKESLDGDTTLINKLLEIKPSNVLLFVNILTKYINITEEYKFQKLYIEELLKKKLKKDINADVDTIKSEAIYFLHKEFGLNSDIEEEYSEYTQLVDTEKYNL